MNYYIKMNDNVFGPYPLNQVQGFVAEGRINSNSMVSKDGVNWLTASSFSEIFSVLPMPSTPGTANNGIPQQNKSSDSEAITYGIISLFVWLIPIIGLPVSIIGFVKGNKTQCTAAIVMSCIGLGLSVITFIMGLLIMLAEEMPGGY